jgi:hypothetical protein
MYDVVDDSASLHCLRVCMHACMHTYMQGGGSSRGHMGDGAGWLPARSADPKGRAPSGPGNRVCTGVFGYSGVAVIHLTSLIVCKSRPTTLYCASQTGVIGAVHMRCYLHA